MSSLKTVLRLRRKQKIVFIEDNIDYLTTFAEVTSHFQNSPKSYYLV